MRKNVNVVPPEHILSASVLIFWTDFRSLLPLRSELNSFDFERTDPRTDELTCFVDVLLARVPDAGVEAAEEEAVVPGLPAVMHLVLVRLVHAVVDAVVAPLLAAVGLGDALGALAPVRGDEGGGGEEQGHQV